MATKSDLATTVKEELPDWEMTQREAEELVGVLFDGIVDVLKDGDFVSIRNFGKFSTVTRKARKGRNPKTGETIQIQEKQGVRFKPSGTFVGSVQPS